MILKLVLFFFVLFFCLGFECWGVISVFQFSKPIKPGLFLLCQPCYFHKMPLNPIHNETLMLEQDQAKLSTCECKFFFREFTFFLFDIRISNGDGTSATASNFNHLRTTHFFPFSTYALDTSIMSIKCSCLTHILRASLQCHPYIKS